MLHGKLSLFDIRDVEAYCLVVLEQRNFELGFHDREDLLAYLIEVTWEESLVFDASRYSAFSDYISRTLTFRAIDWSRRRFGRTTQTWSAKAQHHNGKAGRIERTLPTFVALDDRPDVADHRFEDDLAAGGLADLIGIQRTRGGAPARSDDLGDTSTHGRAA